MGTSFILVTHDLGVAAQISDRIAVLYGGRLAEAGAGRDACSPAASTLTPGGCSSRASRSSRTKAAARS